MNANEDQTQPDRPPELIDLGELELSDTAPFEERHRRVEGTRSRLAYSLVGLLGIVLLLLFGLLAFDRIETRELLDIAGIMLAPLVGLVGSATGYYYAKTDR
jgi:hypothetical protein